MSIHKLISDTTDMWTETFKNILISVRVFFGYVLRFKASLMCYESVLNIMDGFTF